MLIIACLRRGFNGVKPLHTVFSVLPLLVRLLHRDTLFRRRLRLKMQLENRKESNSSCRNCYVCHSSYYTRDNIDGFPVEKLRK